MPTEHFFSTWPNNSGNEKKKKPRRYSPPHTEEGGGKEIVTASPAGLSIRLQKKADSEVGGENSLPTGSIFFTRTKSFAIKPHTLLLGHP